MTPGPLGKLLDKAAPLVPDQRESPRLPGPEFEAILKDVTTVYKITRAEDEKVPKAETIEWYKWWDELTADWKGALKRCAVALFLSCHAPGACQLIRDGPTDRRREESRPSQTARKRTKLSPSPGTLAACVQTVLLP